MGDESARVNGMRPFASIGEIVFNGNFRPPPPPVGMRLSLQ